MEQHEIVINGLKTSFLHKKAANPSATVVFVHGYPFAKELWLGQLAQLPDGIEGIAYDIRGFGSSDRGHTFLSVDLFAGDLLAFMNALGLQKCILCGISMGGYITLRALEKEPAAIAGLVLCDTTSLADTNEAKLKRFGSIESILGSGASAYAGEFIRTIFSEDTLNAKSEPVERIHKMISSTPADVLCATLLALASRTDTTQILEKINVPTLILRGEFDRIIGHDHALALHMGIRNSRQATIADAAHLPNLENPEAFNSCLSGFLSAFLR